VQGKAGIHNEDWKRERLSEYREIIKPVRHLRIHKMASTKLLEGNIGSESNVTLGSLPLNTLIFE
jgi:hypothetical protein